MPDEEERGGITMVSEPIRIEERAMARARSCGGCGGWMDRIEQRRRRMSGGRRERAEVGVGIAREGRA